MKIKELKESVDLVYDHLHKVGLENTEVEVRIFSDSKRPSHVAGLIISGNKPELFVIVKSSRVRKK